MSDSNYIQLQLLATTDEHASAPDANFMGDREIALNRATGVLYYKDNTGTVGVLARISTMGDLQDHKEDTNNPHGVTKTQVGLSDVSNDAQLKIASNLSDLDNKSTSRTNLDVYAKSETYTQLEIDGLLDGKSDVGHDHVAADVTDLGDSATLNIGTTSGTVAAGNDSRFPTSDQKAALTGTSGTAPSATNKFVTNDTFSGHVHVVADVTDLDTRLQTSTWPATPTAAGELGQISFKEDTVAMCVGSNKWVYLAVSPTDPT